MAINYPSPCLKCSKENCQEKKCTDWLMRYLYRQKQINAYARGGKWQQPDETRLCYVYEHPDVIREYLQKGPCRFCQREKDCDTPCQAYWRWWDARQEWHRKRLGAGKEEMG